MKAIKITLVVNSDSNSDLHTRAKQLRDELLDLGFEAEISSQSSRVVGLHNMQLREGVIPPEPLDRSFIFIDDPGISSIEQIVRLIPFDFDKLAPVVEGESKIVHRLTEKLVVEKFKPSVYSYTHNRYGNAHGTDNIRAYFSANVFREMQKLPDHDLRNNAFVALVETAQGPLTVQKYVTNCNLEVRVKRYHIGSPLHRYHYAHDYPSTQKCGPVKKWSRFDQPVVCFDWRNPLTNEEGVRLADEPISDDYANLWMEDVPAAKTLARNAFLFLENLFQSANLQLVDICFFIDRTGHVLYGEISPDCMRVRETSDNLADANIYDKDLWRKGHPAYTLSEKYQALHNYLFDYKQFISNQPISNQPISNQLKEDICQT